MASFWYNKPIVTNLKNNDYQITKANIKVIENIKNRYVYSRDEPLKIPSKYKWCSDVFSTNIAMLNNIDEIKIFLNKNYCDDSCSLRDFFTSEYLEWLLCLDNITITIRNDSNEIVGLIIGIVKSLCIFDTTYKICEIPIICVAKEKQHKNMFCVLFDELTRLMTHSEIIVGMGISNYDKLTNICKYRTYSKPINIDKLVSNKCITEEMGDIMKKKIYAYKVNYIDLQTYMDKFQISERDIHENIYNLYSKYINRYNFVINYSFEDFCKKFFNKYIDIYVKVVKDVIVDFIALKKNYSCSKEVWDSLSENVSVNDDFILKSELYFATTFTNSIDIVFSNVISISDGKYDVISTNNLGENTDALLIEPKILDRSEALGHDFITNTKNSNDGIILFNIDMKQINCSRVLLV